MSVFKIKRLIYMNKIAIIVDSLQNDNKKLFFNEIERNILKICAAITHVILKIDSFIQINIIALLEDSVMQISHLSGNILHHYQGIRRCLRKRTKNKNLVIESIDIVRRIFFENRRKNGCGIFFINNNFFHNNNFHQILAGLIKNNITFYGISLGNTTFILKTLCRVTGGVNFVSYQKNMKQIIINIKKILSNNQKFIGNIFKPCIFGKKFFFFLKISISEINFLEILIEFCPQCKYTNGFVYKEFCFNCGFNFHSIKINKSNFFKKKPLKGDLLVFYNFFSVFFSKLIWKNRLDSNKFILILDESDLKHKFSTRIYQNYFLSFFFFKSTFSNIKSIFCFN